MSLTKSTVRALAASVAIVAVGATVAGAAVFQLPILGFGRADVASANVASVRVPARAVTKKVHPRVIIKTKYVDDIVHRSAPARTYSAPSATATVTSWVAPAVALAPTVAARTTARAVTPPSTPAAHHDDSGAHDTEHEGPPPSAGSASSAPVSVQDR